MSEGYDDDDIRTWPLDQQKLYDQVWHGLIDGNLKPLETYLRSAYPIPRSLRRDIADCILGADTLHRIECKKRRSGPGGIREAVAYHERIKAITEYVESRIPPGSRGYLPRAIHAAAEAFEVSPGSVKKARNEYRRRVKAGHAGGVFAMRGWADLKAPNRIELIAVEVTDSDE